MWLVWRPLGLAPLTGPVPKPMRGLMMCGVGHGLAVWHGRLPLWVVWLVWEVVRMGGEVSRGAPPVLAAPDFLVPPLIVGVPVEAEVLGVGAEVVCLSSPCPCPFLVVPPSPSPPLVVVEVVVLLSESTKSGVPPVGLVVSVVGLMNVLWVM